MKYYIHLLCLVPMQLCLLPNWPENKFKKKVKAQNLYKRIKDFTSNEVIIAGQLLSKQSQKRSLKNSDFD